jgi:nitroreductase
MATIDPARTPPAYADGAVLPPVAPSLETLTLLGARRSAKPFHLLEPAPSDAQLATLLRLASRIPDHGKLAPWRFIVFAGEGRARAGEALASVAPVDATDMSLQAIRETFTRSAMVVAVVSTAAPHPKIPEWEQILAAGAVCYNLELAATAMGFGAVWLTGWAAYDARAREALGLTPSERIAGFVHLGTQTERQTERVRPDVAKLTTRF